MKQSERVKMMKAGFMAQREQGKSIAEIAKLFQVSSVSVYQSLQEIADENGVTRESLLYFEGRGNKEGRHRSKKETVDPNEVKKEFAGLLEKVDGIINKIEKALQED